jgi:hypothetical protein
MDIPTKKQKKSDAFTHPARKLRISWEPTAKTATLL